MAAASDLEEPITSLGHILNTKKTSVLSLSYGPISTFVINWQFGYSFIYVNLVSAVYGLYWDCIVVGGSSFHLQEFYFFVWKAYIFQIHKSITMCSLSYPSYGFMTTPEIGHRMYNYTLCGRKALWSHESARTASSERCIVQILNVPQGDSLPNPTNCTGSERNIQKI